jgi:hypothetical protein
VEALPGSIHVTAGSVEAPPGSVNVPDRGEALSFGGEGGGMIHLDPDFQLFRLPEEQ